MARWSELIWDDAPMEAQQVQSAVPRPAPVERPGATWPEPQPRQRPQQARPQAPAAAAPQVAPEPQIPAQAAPALPGMTSEAERRANAAEADALMESNIRQGERDRAKAETKRQPQQPAPRRWSESIFDDQPTTGSQGQMGTPKQPAGSPTADPNAEPDAKTWLGRRWQDIVGKQDKRYTGLPAIAEVMLREKRAANESTLPQAKEEAIAWSLGASDDDMARNYKFMLGNRFLGVEKDANGYPIINYRDQDGKPAKAYANVPGLDMQDVARAGFGVLPFLGAGKLASAGLKGAGLGARAVGQGVTQAGTSVATDMAREVTGYGDAGSVGDMATKAGMVGALGAGGELLGAAGASIYRRLVTEPRLFDQAKGQLTEAGLKAAREAGLPDELLTPEFSQRFAKHFAHNANAREAAAESMSREHMIPRSRGEVTGNRQDLLREQQMRGGTYGEQAAARMKDFDQRQREATINAVRGDLANGEPGLAARIAPERAGEARSMAKGDTGANIRGNTQAAYDAAKEAEKAAWDAVPSLKAAPEALADLDRHVAARASGLLIDDAVTPIAARMAKELERFKSGAAPDKVASILPDTPAGDVGVMRKRLLRMRNTAATPEDGAAAKALYDSFLDWEQSAAQAAGDMTGAAASRTARSLTRQVHEIFDGQKGTAASRILGQVLKEGKNDSAEGVVNALFTGPTSEVKNGTVSALMSLKRGYDTYLDPAAAKAAWDDIRLAHLLKMTTTKGNEANAPAVMASAIKNALGTQQSVMRALYSPAEIASMRQLALTMDRIKMKNPNTSWSGIAIGALVKDGLNALVSAIGFNSPLARAAGHTVLKRPMESWGNIQAGIATGNGQGFRPRPALPSYGWAGGAAGARSRDE